MAAKKPRVGFFSFTSCEGCQLAVLECENELPALLDAIDLVRFREASSFEGREIDGEFDLTFIEGSVTTEHDQESVKEIRRRSKVLVALGACAVTAGVNAMKNLFDLAEIKTHVYGEHADWYNSIPARPVRAVVKTDFQLRGCPIDRSEFLDAVTRVLRGLPFPKATTPMCAECKRAGVVCRLLKGKPCLGPVVACGCGAVCTRHGQSCEGCRGLLASAPLESIVKVFEGFGLSREQAIKQFKLFNAYDTEVLQ